MLVAGEASGDALAAELVEALMAQTGGRLQCFGAGGPQMAAAGVDLAVDLTQHSTIGLVEVVRRYGTFRRIFSRLLDLAVERRPDVVICVDFSGFNRRFAHALRKRTRAGRGGWRPGIVQYVSPQVWASRPRRARALARDLDLLLAIFPFEPAWYAERAPELHVEFVGHPMLDRYGTRTTATTPGASADEQHSGHAPRIALLPGSREGEVRRHLPVMIEAAAAIRRARPDATFRVVAAHGALAPLVDRLSACATGVDTQMGGLADALSSADLAIASTGTVTMECAYFGVPTVAMYKTSWLTYTIGRRLVTVPHLAMPNLIARTTLFPELVQHEATPGRVAREALQLLGDEARRAEVKAGLARVIASIGEPGASGRAARAIVEMMR